MSRSAINRVQTATRAAPYAAQLVAVFMVVGGSYALGAELSWRVFAANIGLAFFPPAGVTLAAIVLLPPRYWPAVVSAIWCVELIVDHRHGLSFGVAAGYALANSVEPLVGGMVFRRVAGRPFVIATRVVMGWFIVAAVAAGPAAGAIIGGTTKALDSSTPWLDAVAHFWAGDGLGVLVVGAAIFALSDATRIERSRVPEGLAVLLAASALSALTFTRLDIAPSLFLFPVLVWAAVRFTSTGVAVVGLIVAFIANYATAQGQGPLAALESLSLSSQLAVTQVFLATMILTAWFVAIEARERIEALTQQVLERAARERAESLHGIGSLSSALLGALTVKEVAAVANEHARRSFGASARLTLRPSNQDETRFEVFGGSDEEVGAVVGRASRTTLDRELRTPGNDAARDQHVVLARSFDEIVRQYPDLAPSYRSAGVEATIAVPLRGHGITGAMSFEFVEPRRFDDVDDALLAAFVDVVGQALERSTTSANERRRLRLVERTSRLASGLASADTTDAVFAVVVDLLPGLVAPADLTVVSITLSGSQPRVAYSANGASSLAEVPRGIATALGVALRTDAQLILRCAQDLVDLGEGATPDDWDDWGALVIVPISVPNHQFGALALTLAPPLFLNDVQMVQIRLVAEIIAQSLARAEAFEEHKLVRRFAEALEDSTSGLASVAPDLAYGASAASILEQATEVLQVDAAALIVMDDDRRRIVGTQGERGMAGPSWASRLAASEPNPFVDAARSESLVAVHDENAWRDRYPTLLPADGLTPFVTVPVSRGGQGPRLVLALSFAPPAVLTDQMLRLLPFMALRWGDQLERALLAEREEIARARLASLQLVTADLATARTEADLADAITRGAAGVFGARHAAIGVIEPGSTTPRGIGSTAEFVRQELMQHDLGPGAAAVSEQRAIYVSSPLELMTRFPAIAAAAARAGAHALAALPLIDRRRPVGALVLDFASDAAFDVLDTRLLDSFADLCAQALERIQLADHEHQAALELQHAMLGEPDLIPGLDADFAYRPADRRLDVGGDWYDVITLPEDRIGLVVGDVVGHNVTAAATMGQLRSAVRALAPLIDDPASLVTQLETFVEGLEPAKSTTVMYAVFDPATRTLRYHSAGHPPAIVVDEHRVHFLDDGRGPPLGTVVRRRVTAETMLSREASLVLYTDGLIERRGESLDIGLARLAQVATLLAGRESSWGCGSLVGAMTSGTDPQDDIAVLMVRSESPIGTVRSTQHEGDSTAQHAGDPTEWVLETRPNESSI